MNYIVEIADLLGVGLYKNFTIEGFEDTDFKLTANGLFYYDNRTFTWEKSLLLDDILIGTISSSLFVAFIFNVSFL